MKVTGDKSVEGAIVGSNSVVISDVPAFSIAVGNPACVILKNNRAKPAP
jgi:acetyltransferase-like isoleucine patch superfamily enzyme